MLRIVMLANSELESNDVDASIGIDVSKSLRLIKFYRKTINQLNSKKQSIVATKSGRTYYELILEELFKLLGIEIETDAFLCFNCNEYFFYTSAAALMPAYCPRCKTEYSKSKPGQFSKPDFIITNRFAIYKKFLVMYVNGILHQKKHFQNKDYHQIKHLLENGIKVVIIENDMIKDNSNDFLAAFCQMAHKYITCDKYYEIYKQSSEPFLSLKLN